MVRVFQTPSVGTKTQPLSYLINGLLQEKTRHSQQGYTPAADFWETEHAYALEVALPGLKKEDVQVEFEAGMLIVQGTRAFKQDNPERKYHRVENQYGSFKRSFQLPEHIDTGAIEAGFENGVLYIMIPKIEELVRKRQITVK